MQELNNGQLILLALLVSFVTSIATGIVTVSLVDQAPTDVTRTIDRVVERTVETVVPGETTIVERIKEVNVGESDETLTTRAINRSLSAVASVAGQSGFFVSEDGHFLTFNSGIFEANEFYRLYWPSQELPEVDDNATTTPELEPIFVEVVDIYADEGLLLMKVVKSEGSEDEEQGFFERLLGNKGFPHLSLNSTEPALGSKLIALGINGEVESVSIGVATSIDDAILSSNISGARHFRGGPVVGLKGGVMAVGLSTASGSLEGHLAAHLSSLLSEHLAKAPAEDNTANASEATE